MNIAGKKMPAWLIIAYVVALSAICAWPLIAYFSAFLFDAPNAASQPGTYVTMGIMLGYPILPILGVIGSFFAARGDRGRLAIGLAALALLPFVAIALLLAAGETVNIIAILGNSL